jgi:hypothetical protein
MQSKNIYIDKDGRVGGAENLKIYQVGNDFYDLVVNGLAASGRLDASTMRAVKKSARNSCVFEYDPTVDRDADPTADIDVDVDNLSPDFGYFRSAYLNRRGYYENPKAYEEGMELWDSLRAAHAEKEKSAGEDLPVNVNGRHNRRTGRIKTYDVEQHTESEGIDAFTSDMLLREFPDIL